MKKLPVKENKMKQNDVVCGIRNSNFKIVEVWDYLQEVMDEDHDLTEKRLKINVMKNSENYEKNYLTSVYAIIMSQKFLDGRGIVSIPHKQTINDNNNVAKLIDMMLLRKINT